MAGSRRTQWSRPRRAVIYEASDRGPHRDKDFRRYPRRLVRRICPPPELQVGYVWHASKFTSEVLAGLLRIGFIHPQQIIWDKRRTVLTRTLYWFQHEPCWFVRKKNAPWYGKAGENSTIWCSPSPKFIMGGSDEEETRPSNSKANRAYAQTSAQPHAAWRVRV